MKAMKRNVWKWAGAWLVIALVGAGGCGGQEVHWMLWNKYIRSESGNMSSVTCGEAQGGDIVITVTSESSRKSATTRVSCPSGEFQGDTLVELPEVSGTFTICGKLSNKPKSTSQKVMGAAASDSIGLTIYADGCDLEACTCP